MVHPVSRAQMEGVLRIAVKGSKSVLNENLDILHKLAEVLLEKETVMGKELDELIHSLRPGIELPSKSADDQEATTETAADQS